MLWKQGRFRVEEFPTGECFTLPAATTLIRPLRFTVPASLAGERFEVGFALRRAGYTNWFNGNPVPTRVDGVNRQQ